MARVEAEMLSAGARNLNTTTKAFVADLRRVTPVDTGLARDSWRMDKVVNGYDVINDVAYIERLNAGSSKQAPQHFVEASALKYGTPLGAIVESKK